MKLLEPNWQELDIRDSEYIQNLHPVFKTELDTFPDITGATVQGQIRLWDVLQTIKYNLGQDIDASTYLLNKYVDGVLNDDYDQRKKQLPAICYNARFKGYKDLKHLKSITKLMFLDIDEFDSREMALQYKQEIIEKYDWILVCNLSLSKLGLHVVVMVDKIWDNNDYNMKYDYISQKYFNGRLDKKSLSLTRYTVIPYDFNIYINESPVILDIEDIIRNDKKGILSAYNEDDKLSQCVNQKGTPSAYNGYSVSSMCVNQKGTPSAYNNEINSIITDKEKGMGSAYKKEKIICTEYTFLPHASLNPVMNDAARQMGLRFRQDIDESIFQDSNIPLYVHEGMDVMEVNLHPYRNSKVKTGNRTSFIGALTIRMIYLNIESPDSIDPDKRKQILKFIKSVNNNKCEPPLSTKEVLNSFNANFKKYKTGDIDFCKYFKKQRSFWSKNTTLKGNEKRKVTCKIKNEPIVIESQNKIYNAIETLLENGNKVTQEKVSNASGLSISTVKKHWKDFKEFVKFSNTGIMDYAKVPKKLTVPEQKEEHTAFTESGEVQLPVQIAFDKKGNSTIKESITEIENIDIIDCDEDTLVIGEEFKFKITDDQTKAVFDRIFSSINKKLDENQGKKLFNEFVKQLNALPNNDVRILSLNIDDINDSTTFFRQSTLENKIQEKCKSLIPLM